VRPSRTPSSQALITSYSVAIARHCGRQFAPAEDSATHRFRLRPGSTLDGLYVLDLAPYDLRAATLVQLHPETTSPVTLTAGVDYTTEPANPRDGVHTSLSLYPLRITWTSTAAINFGYVNVDVTGAWGFEEVPEDVKQACILAVSSRAARERAGVRRRDAAQQHRRGRQRRGRARPRRPRPARPLPPHPFF
jgi:hypothetical protein